MKAEMPVNETARLDALRRYSILDTAPEQDFDDITLLASHVCGAPIALISLVDENRQWFKSKVGTNTTETSRDIAFCAHGILQTGVFEVADALQDARFADNPLVTGDSKLRFYAGAPLVSPDGHALGMLCVNDQVPRELLPAQKAALQALSRQVVAQLELRNNLKELQHQVAERTAAEQAVRESEEKFRQLAGNITDLFWMTSPDLEQIHYLSPAYERIWGRPASRLYAAPREWIDAIKPEDREIVAHSLARLAGEETSVHMEFRITRPDGDTRWISNRAFQIRDADGRVIRLTGIATDITEQKAAEAALRQAHGELVAASRLAGMAEVATGVLHNVGNVLNSLNVSASVITSGLRQSKVESLAKIAALLEQHQGDLAAFLTADPKGRRLPELIRSLARHSLEERDRLLGEIASLQQNVDHIKEIVSLQQGYSTMVGIVEPLAAPALIEDALRMNSASLTRHIVRIERAFTDVPPVLVEKGKVLQILVNLIRNAQQACESTSFPDRVITLGLARGPGGEVCLSVGDNGSGIKPENLTRIFAHGFTTKATGHGFGLHSAANAAREMNGSLTAHSDGPGRGATFTLTLPAAAPGPEEPRARRRGGHRQLQPA